MYDSDYDETDFLLRQESSMRFKIKKLRESLQWALSNLNCEPYEWSTDEQADAHESALQIIEETKDVI